MRPFQQITKAGAKPGPSQGKGQNTQHLSAQSLTYKILEASYILEHSVNIHTIRDRAYIFQTQLIALVNKRSGASSKLDLDIEKGIDLYRRSYWDKVVSPWALALVRSPESHISDLTKQVQQVIFTGWERHYTDQILQIEKLKRSGAKIKRLNKLLELCNLLRLESIRLCGETFNYDFFKSEIERFLELLDPPPLLY